jgi:flavin reductase (DIM6/NTAB) family NADH-FMN oxidoreductase RutF
MSCLTNSLPRAVGSSDIPRGERTSRLLEGAVPGGTAQNGVDSLLFRQVLGCFGSGVTVITTTLGQEVRGMTASAFMSGSLRPPLVVASIGRDTKIHELLGASGVMGISILSAEQEACSRRFSGQAAGHVEEPPPLEFANGVPIVSKALAVLTTKICAQHACGDHTLFVGRVDYLAYAETHEPLLYYRGRYQRLCSGTNRHEMANLREPAEWTIGW